MSDLRDFLNTVRRLHCIDYPDFAAAIEALGDLGDPAEPQWPRFRDNPVQWMLRAPDLQARAIWELVKPEDAEPSS